MVGEYCGLRLLHDDNETICHILNPRALFIIIRFSRLFYLISRVNARAEHVRFMENVTLLCRKLRQSRLRMVLASHRSSNLEHLVQGLGNKYCSSS